MNIKVFQNRKIEKDYFYNEGTQNENSITVLTFEVPLGYEDFSKRIVFITEDGNFWDYIPENEYEIKNNITKYGTIEAYLWLTKDEQDFRSQKFELNFYENENADNMTPSEEQVDGFNTLITELEVKINEINDLKPELDKALEKIENYDTDLQGIKNDIAERLTEEEAKKIFYTETEVDEMIKEIQETNEYQSEIIDQFKNEFKQITVSGDSIHITDAAELPLGLVPYGEPTQVVIPEELGTTVEGEVVSFSDADLSKETKATINGNTYQEVIEEELGTTVEGESVVVSDGDVDKEVKATVNGNSYQETTEGYNLYNYGPGLQSNPSGLTVEYDEKTGYITVNGTPTKAYIGICSSINITDILEDGETYTLKQEQYASANGGVYVQIVATDLAGKDNHLVASSASRQIKIDKSNFIRYSIMVQTGPSLDAFNNYRNRYWLYKGTDDKPFEIYTNGVATPNTENPKDIEVVDTVNLLQVNETKFELTDNGIKNLGWNSGELLGKQINLKANVTYYLKFVLLSRPTSSTSFTSYIDNVPNDNLGMINIDVASRFGIGQLATREYTPTKDEVLTIKMWGNENKDIFEFQYWITTIPDAPYLKYGHIGLLQKNKNICPTDFNNWESGHYGTDGNKVDYAGRIRFKDLLPINSNEIYYFDVFNNEFSFGARLYDKDKKYIETTVGGITNKTTKKFPAEACYLGVFIFKIDMTSYVSFEEYQAMFESGQIKPFICLNSDKNKDFEPHQEAVHSIDLAGEKLAKVGDIKDLLNIGVNGLANIKKIIKTIELTGDENIVMSTTSDNFNRFSIVLPDIKYEDIDGRFMDIMCNYFRPYYNNSYSMCFRYKNQIFFYPDSSITTVAEFKSWLKEKYNSGNPLKVMYLLAETEVIDLPSIEPIKLSSESDTFELITNIGTTMAVNYNYVTPAPSADRDSEIEVIDTGCNLLNTNKSVDAWIDVSGLINSSKLSKVTDYLPIKANTNFTFSFSYSSLGSESSRQICVFDHNKKALPAQGINYMPTEKQEIIINLPQDGYVRITYDANAEELMFCEGVNKPYLPYGHIGLVQRGANIFVPTDKVDEQAITIQNGTVALQEDEYTFNATANDMYFGQITDAGKQYSKKVGTLYNVKGKSKIYFLLTNNLFAKNLITVYDSNFVSLGFTMIRANKGSYTIPENAEYITFRFGVESSTVGTTYKTKVMLSFEEITDYEKYKEPIVHEIDLAGNTLALNDNAEISVSGSVKANKVMKEYIVTGDETFRLGTTKTKTQVFEMTFPDSKNSNYILCNYLPNFTNGDVEAIKKIDIFVFMAVQKEIADTVEKLKAWLKEKYNAGEPLKLMYVLDTPEVIDLPSIKPITLFEGTNVFELVTNIGTTMAVTYNYVTPSPSIDRPSEIFTVQGNYETVIGNANLIDEKLVVKEGTYNGITRKFENGELIVNGTPLYNYVLFGSALDITDLLQDGETYTLFSSNSQFKVYNQIVIENKNGKKEYVNTLNSTVASFKVDKKDIVSFKYSIQSGLIDKVGTLNNYRCNFMLLQGKYSEKDILKHIPHQSTTLPLTVGNELLGEIVTLTEEEADALKLDGAGKYRRTDYGRYVFTGDENWNLNNTVNGNIFYKSMANVNITNELKPIFCNLLTYIPIGWENCKDEQITKQRGNQYIFFRIDKFTTVDELKSWLKEKYNNSEPLETIYSLKTPTYEKITDETVLAQLKEYDKQIAFYRVNNINTYLLDDTNAAPLKIHATYSKSNKLTIQSLEDRLASLESQVTNLQDNQI